MNYLTKLYQKERQIDNFLNNKYCIYQNENKTIKQTCMKINVQVNYKIENEINEWILKINSKINQKLIKK